MKEAHCASFSYNEYVKDFIKTIAKRIEEKGGQAYFVGGAVRDELMGIKSKDYDVEVFGIQEEELVSILKEFSEVLHYGSSFGIYSLKGYPFDFALPRKEIKTKEGHRGFDVEVDPLLSIEAAARRRDFTINAIYKNILSEEILDPYSGQEDLKNKILRHVDDASFVEDPLRVLRAAQFASRFDLEIDNQTMKLMSLMDLTSLSKERVEDELKKALLSSGKPSIFFEVLKNCNQLHRWFFEIEELIDCAQDPIYHPEGSVYVHTMQVLDEAAKYREKVNCPYEFMLLALTHDFGKKIKSFEDGDRIHNYDHEKDFTLTKPFIDRLILNNDMKDYLYNMIPLHMSLNTFYRWKHESFDFYKIYQKAQEPIDLIYFNFADHPSEFEDIEDDDRFVSMMSRLLEYQMISQFQFISGQDLIDIGYKPNEQFKEMIDYGNDLALMGIQKEEIINKIKDRYKE